MELINEGTIRASDHITFNRRITNYDGTEEMMHHTGYEGYFDGEWHWEFIDSKGRIYYAM